MAGAGSVVIDLLMRTGQFETDVGRAQKILDKLDKSINKQVDALKLQAATLGMTTRESTLFALAQQGATTAQLKNAESALAQVEAYNKLQAAGKVALKVVAGLGVAAIAAAAGFVSLVDEAGNFKDLEEETGASAESLASLAVAAAVAGLSVNDVAGATVKLTKALTGLDDDSKPAGAAIKSLGLDLQEFKKLDPVQQIDALTAAFNRFKDGPQKTAVAVQLFRGEGAKMLKLFKELGEEGGRQVILTQDQIDIADEFSDRQKKSAATLKLYAEAASTLAVPALTALTEAATEGVKQLLGFDKVGKDLANANPVAMFAEAAAREVANLLDYIAQSGRELSALVDFGVAYATIAKQLSTLDIKGAKQTGAEFRARYGLDENGRKVVVGEAQSQAHLFRDAFDKALADRKTKAAQPKAVDDRPELKANAPSKSHAAEDLKKSLDGQLKLIADFGRAQADAYKLGESYLSGVYADGLISQRSFFDTQKNLREAELQNTLDTIDKEIAALRAYAANPLTKPSDRIAANEKIKLSIQQRADAVTKAAGAEILAEQQNGRAIEALQDRYDDLRASVIAAGGDEFGAAQIRIARQVRDANRLATQAGGDHGVVDELQRQLELRATAQQQQKDYQKLLDESANREANIYADANAGGETQVETLAKIRDARTVALEQLGRMVEAARALAEASGNDADIKHANDLALAYKHAADEIDPLAKKINSSLEDSASAPFADFILGTQTASQAFRSFTSSVLKNLADIASKNLAKTIFGDTGGSSGIGGLLSRLFGTSSSTGVATNTTGTSLPTAGGADGGTNFVERDMLTILHKGEAVVPKAYNPGAGAMGGRSGGVQIVNNLGVQARGRQEEQQQPDGSVITRVILDSVAKDLGQGTGPVATAYKARFGFGPGNLARRK
jgi:hypothetical protein